MEKMYLVKFANCCLPILLFTINCSTSSILTKYDYHTSRTFYSRGESLSALKYFPHNVEDGFITTMEKTYLNLISGIPSIESLEKYAASIEKRLRFSATRELKSFFYLETPEGYYASEHEVIWMHLLLSWGYSLKGEFEKAAIEARISSNLLNGQWSEEGRFDDPMLRVFLGALWAMCGHWEDARVDFRVASNLQPNLRWARELADSDEVVENLVIVFGGTGPEAVWSPELDVNPLRSARGIEFRQFGKKSLLSIKDSSGKFLKSAMTTDSKNWYKRHFLRENAIKNFIDDSKYGQQMFAAGAISTAKIVAGVTVGIVVGTLSVAAGGALVYAGFKVGSDAGAGLIALGFGVGVGGVGWSYDFAKKTSQDALDEARDSLDTSKNYRYVRFLPEYIWVGWAKKPVDYPIHGIVKNQPVFSIFPPHKPPAGKPTVSITFVPDS